MRHEIRTGDVAEASKVATLIVSAIVLFQSHEPVVATAASIVAVMSLYSALRQMLFVERP